jgi:hypothetical protein
LSGLIGDEVGVTLVSLDFLGFFFSFLPLSFDLPMIKPPQIYASFRIGRPALFDASASTRIACRFLAPLAHSRNNIINIIPPQKQKYFVSMKNHDDYGLYRLAVLRSNLASELESDIITDPARHRLAILLGRFVPHFARGFGGRLIQQFITR